jgi:uncharacterized protein (TIGR03067 family)
VVAITALVTLLVGVAWAPCGPAQKPVAAQKPPADNHILWGDAVDGVQLGIATVPGGNRMFQAGDTVTFSFHLRNVGGKPWRAIWNDEAEGPPLIEDATGKPVHLVVPQFSGGDLKGHDLAAGEEIELFRGQIIIVAGEKKRLAYLYQAVMPPGYYRVSFNKVAGVHDRKPNQILHRNLSTPKLPIVIVAPAAPEAEAGQLPAVERELRLLQGTWWRTVRHVSYSDHEKFARPNLRYVFQGDQFTMIEHGKEISRGVLTVDPVAQTLDLKVTAGEGRGETLKAYYTLKANVLLLHVQADLKVRPPNLRIVPVDKEDETWEHVRVRSQVTPPPTPGH